MIHCNSWRAIKPSPPPPRHLFLPPATSAPEFHRNPPRKNIFFEGLTISQGLVYSRQRLGILLRFPCSFGKNNFVQLVANHATSRRDSEGPPIPHPSALIRARLPPPIRPGTDLFYPLPIRPSPVIPPLPPLASLARQRPNRPITHSRNLAILIAPLPCSPRQRRLQRPCLSACPAHAGCSPVWRFPTLFSRANCSGVLPPSLALNRQGERST